MNEPQEVLSVTEPEPSSRKRSRRTWIRRNSRKARKARNLGFSYRECLAVMRPKLHQQLVQAELDDSKDGQYELQLRPGDIPHSGRRRCVVADAGHFTDPTEQHYATTETKKDCRHGERLCRDL